MPVTLSIRNVPDEVAARLRARAKANHRSVQGELLAVLQEIGGDQAAKGKIAEVAAEIRKLSLPPMQRNESTKMIREDRDR